jgi:2-Cys peroxiredoxin 5
VAAVGSRIPAITLTENTPGNKVDAAELCAGKRVIIFGVPGAFTPGCSKSHLPGYIEAAAALKAKGVDELVCVSVNDAFVMAAWGEAHGAAGKVRLLADAGADLTRALGMDFNVAPLGGVRSKRYSMLVENGEIKELNVEPDNTGLSCSLAKTFVDKMK